MKIGLLMASVKHQDLVLPEFQREYVWNREQAKELLVSLVKDYPVGSLLFWRTPKPPELKNIKAPEEKLGTVSVILDGQQRLTTLYLLLVGEIPPYYRPKDIGTDPRDLHYHLGTRDFQYYQKSRMEMDPLWIRVADCFNGTDINVFHLAEKRAAEDKEKAFRLAQLYTDSLTALKNVREKDIPEQVVPGHASITEAIDIFDRVNSQGTKLTDAELALTHVTGKWPEARRELKKKIDELAKHHFYFNLTFMVRALTAVATRRALYETIHDKPRDEVVAGWQRLSKRLDYLVSVLPTQAFIHSTEDLSTPNVLVPLLLYLDLQEGRFPSEKAAKHAIHWLYGAQMWARYTAQTDQRLEHDLSVVVRERSPWSQLVNQIIDQRGRVEVKAADLEGRGMSHPLYRTVAIVAKAHGAVDWFNGAPLGTVTGKTYRLHSHHIFPRAVLHKHGYQKENHLHRKVMNEIANRAFLTAESNYKLRDVPPGDYLPDVEQKYPAALSKQFVPVSPELWRVEHYRQFLQARRELIARKINEFMASLIAEPEPHTAIPAEDLRKLGESATLEFKSTLRWDVIRNQVNKDLELSVLKTIAAFLNSDGGTLMIGVEDDGNVLGLDNDFKTFKKKDADGFEQTLMNLIADRIGPAFAAFLRVRFEQIEGKTVCVVDADQAASPVYTKTPAGTVFFIRMGNTTRPLDPEQTVAYVETHWQ
ncbi:MAG: hypothetical protein AMK72_07655 [Planctomycetes bacterium SM23_25]|nr:MAG: hypothetical protein AMK72_07655 [Planctomycetes bacterium SM23_25]